MLKSMLMATALVSLAACGQGEKAGEKMDSAVENATQGHRNLGDGPLERAGETADHATGSERHGDAADAVHDATDNNNHTHP
jgi:predicted small lipoprotein YifL